MIINARLPEFADNKFYSREFKSAGIRAVRIYNKSGLVLEATHAITDAGVSSINRDLLCRYNIVEIPDKYREILEAHSKDRKFIDADTIFSGGVAFLLNGMRKYWGYTEAAVELDIYDCVNNQPEMVITRTIAYMLSYPPHDCTKHRRGTIALCEAITPQKRLTCLADVFEVEAVKV